MSRIFLSYRRDDSGGWAGRLYDRLSQHFGRENVFMDIDTIEPGLDLVKVIEQAVGSCDVLVALIGKQWLTITDNSGRRRLDNPEDFVRLEIAAALARNIRVIPALVQGARVPHATDLPDGLTSLARRNAIDISETRFHYDVDRLIAVLDNVLQGTVSQPLKPELILIPAGEFLMGSDPQQDKAAQDNERPQHHLNLPDYYLAKTPITNTQYAVFVQATNSDPPKHWVDGKPPRAKEDHPVVHVSWYEAREYCRWLSGVTGKSYSLPSEAEFEKGARGTDGRIYPWGNEWDQTQCNIWERSGRLYDTTPVEAHPGGASPYGALDMAGNVYEWTCSLWGQYPYPSDATERAQRENLQEPDHQARVIRGGSYTGQHRIVRCASRAVHYPNSPRWVIGFRVVVRPTS